MTKAPVQTVPLVHLPFDKVGIDLIGPLSPVSNRANRWVLTVVDYATRYPEAIALSRIDTETIAEAFLGIFSRVGFPKEVLSDNGTQFVSQVMLEVSRLISVKQIFSSPYHPMANGLCDKSNGTLKKMLVRMCSEQPRDWDRYLEPLLFAYRILPVPAALRTHRTRTDEHLSCALDEGEHRRGSGIDIPIRV